MGVANSLRAMHGEHKGKMTKTNLFMADLDLLEEEDGFNIGRDYDDPEVQEHIRNLADAYKAGEDLPPLVVKVLDGRILVRDGHCRRRGALLARSEGAEITRLPIMEVKGDEVDQTMILLTSNDGLKQKPLGRAKIYAKLVNMGLSEDEVAKRTKKTKTHVQQYLALHNLPIKLKEYIKADLIAWSMALELFNEHGTKAVDILEEHQAKNGGPSEPTVKAEAPETGTETTAAGEQEAPAATQPKPKRITRKAIDAATGYRSRLTGTLVKDVTDRISSVVKSLSEAQEDGEHVVVRMTKEEAEALRSLHQSILPPNKGGNDEKAQESESAGNPSDDSDATGSDIDGLYDTAVAFVTETGKANISALQRHLRVGYNQAARLVESMEEAGVVSATDGSGKREVLAEATA